MTLVPNTPLPPAFIPPRAAAAAVTPKPVKALGNPKAAHSSGRAGPHSGHLVQRHAQGPAPALGSIPRLRADEGGHGGPGDPVPPAAQARKLQTQEGDAAREQDGDPRATPPPPLGGSRKAQEAQWAARWARLPEAVDAGAGRGALTIRTLAAFSS